ncbi:MAG: hypothetical protein ACKO2G_03555 [Verrucomicrobiales bacterium]
MSLKASVPFLVCCFASTLTVFGHEPEAHQPFERPHDHESIEGHAHLGWESRYFSEGRDNLDGDSLLVGSFEMGWKHLTGGVWYGYSPDQRYDELQLALSLSQSIGDFEFYGGYTHLRFPFDGAHDNELGAGITWSGLPLDVELSADIYYSFDAEGFFAEISANREFYITDNLSLNVSVPFGINQGYVADGHDGANHIAISAGLEFALTDSISVTAHTAYSWALSRAATSPGDEQLIDFFHGGTALQWSF